MNIFNKFFAIYAGLTLVACSVTIDPQVSENDPVRFKLNALAPCEVSKTSVDDTWKVSWVSGDKILACVGEKDASGAPVNAVFDFNSGNEFGTSAKLNLLESSIYEWNVVYAGEAISKASDAVSVPLLGPVQSKPGDNSHLGGQPLYGYTVTLGAESPNVAMHHLSSVICIKLKNETDSALKIKTVKVSNAAGVPMAGKFSVNCADGSLSSVSTQTYSQISVADGSVASGTVGEFYVPVCPFSIAAGKEISVSLTLDSGKVLTYGKAVSVDTDFEAGHVKSRSISVKESDLTDYYVKITSDSELAEGRYLIVYEDSKLAMNGSTVSDVNNNGVSVNISGSKIEATESVDSYSFILAKSGDEWTIKGSDGNYIGATSNSTNSLNISASTAYKNSITISGSSHTIKGSGGAYLRFNTSASRFRYYKSSSSNNQMPVCLYKRGGSVSGGESGGDSGDSGGEDTGHVSVGGYLGCYEVPAINNLSGNKTTGSNSSRDDNWIRYYTTDAKQQIAVHTFTHPVSDEKVRTYVVLYDESNYAPLWTAHAMHKSMWVDKSVGRHDSWGDDPAISLKQQSGNGSTGYSRGHFVASSDRQSSMLQNKQTFYYSNQAPQWQNSFNSGVWSSLENDIQGHAPSGRDTMYVVTGVLYEGTKTLKSNNGYTVPIPSHFYKLLMKCSFDASGQMTDAEGCAYLFTNEAHTSGKYPNFATTIDAIEQRTGFDFFPAVPAALQSKAESSSVGLW